MSKRFDHYFFTPASALAPCLVARAFLALLAFDSWLVMLVHGGQREGDFNVAHFAFLDALQPEPSPTLYNGVIIAAGLLSFAQSLFGLRRPIMALTTLLYTYGWAMSQLDSYQHHYLLSWFLLCFTLYPSDAQTTKGQGNFYAYRLIGVTTGIVYSYTAISKSAAEWRYGDALMRIAGKKLTPIVDWLSADVGGDGDLWWGLIGHSVLVLQVVVAAAYVLRPLEDLPTTSRLTRRWVGHWSRLGMGAAVSFHIGAEYLGLRIGWFSLYMILLAVVYLAPPGALARLAAWLRSGAEDDTPASASTPNTADHALLEDSVGKDVSDTASSVSSPRLWVLLLLSIPASIVFGHWVDIPGTMEGASLASLLFAADWVLRHRAGASHGTASAAAAMPAPESSTERLRMTLAPTAVALSALAMWTSVVLSAPLSAPCIEPKQGEPTEATWSATRTAYCAATGKLLSPVRFDYYRFVGGDLRRRGEDDRALEAYDKANLYAIPKSRWVPLGRDRRDAADRLRATRRPR